MKVDIDRGAGSTFFDYLFVTAVQDDYSTEEVARLSAKRQIPIPEEGEEISLADEKTSSGSEEVSKTKYEIIEKDYSYSLAEPPEDKLEKGASDAVLVTIIITVEPVEE